MQKEKRLEKRYGYENEKGKETKERTEKNRKLLLPRTRGQRELLLFVVSRCESLLFTYGTIGAGILHYYQHSLETDNGENLDMLLLVVDELR